MQVKTVNGASLGTDVILANGVVHQISKVLIPLDSSISAIVAESDPEFRDLFGFIVLAKLFGTLSSKSIRHCRPCKTLCHSLYCLRLHRLGKTL